MTKKLNEEILKKLTKGVGGEKWKAKITELLNYNDLLGVAKQIYTENYLAIFDYIPNELKYEAFKLSYTGCDNNNNDCFYHSRPQISQEVLETLRNLRPKDELKEWLEPNNKITVYSGNGYLWTISHDNAHGYVNDRNLVVEGYINADNIVAIIDRGDYYGEVICVGDTYDFVNITYARDIDTYEEFDGNDAYEAIYEGRCAEDEPEENEQ